MLKSGLLNPAVLQLLARIRHTNTLVIADRGFPFWPQIETVDISLVDDVPTVLQVLDAIQANFVIGRAYASAEFKSHNDKATQAALASSERRFRNCPVALVSRAMPSSVASLAHGDTNEYLARLYQGNAGRMGRQD